MGLLLGGIRGGGGGGAPPAGGYTTVGEIQSFAVPDGSALSNAQRTLTWIARPPAGQLLVAVAAVHPERTGNAFIRRASDFLTWSTNGGVQIAGNSNSITLLISPRIATGDADDDVLMNGVVGPQALCIFAVGGNAPASLAGIDVGNSTQKTVSDTGAFRDGLFAFGIGFTCRVSATMKANDLSLTANMPSVDAAMDFVRGGSDLNTGSFAGESFCMGVAVKIQPNVVDLPDGAFGITQSYAADSFACSTNWRSGDS